MSLFMFYHSLTPVTRKTSYLHIVVSLQYMQFSIQVLSGMCKMTLTLQYSTACVLSIEMVVQGYPIRDADAAAEFVYLHLCNLQIFN